MSACNMDCFNCQHPDCIIDSVPDDLAILEDSAIDECLKDCFFNPGHRDRAGGWSDYYRRNKEKVKEKRREYVKNNREHVSNLRHEQYKRKHPNAVRYGRGIHKRPVVRISKDGTEKIYPSIRSAANDVGLTPPAIGAVCKKVRNKKTAGGYEWKYAEETSS